MKSKIVPNVYLGLMKTNLDHPLHTLSVAEQTDTYWNHLMGNLEKKRKSVKVYKHPLSIDRDLLVR